MMLTRPLSDSAYRKLSFALALCFCITAIWVHVVRDDLSIWHRTLSIYAVGPAGWVLTLGFFSIAGTQFLIACRLYALRQSMGDRVAAAVLGLAALGILLVAIFPYQSRLPHNSGAALQLGLFPVFLWLRVLLTRTPQHRQVSLRRFTFICALLSTAFFLLLILNGETDYNLGTTAMAQKAQIVINTLWLLVYSWCWPAEKD
jgi:hypothetical protein